MCIEKKGWRTYGWRGLIEVSLEDKISGQGCLLERGLRWSNWWQFSSSETSRQLQPHMSCQWFLGWRLKSKPGSKWMRYQVNNASWGQETRQRFRRKHHLRKEMNCLPLQSSCHYHVKHPSSWRSSKNDARKSIRSFSQVRQGVDWRRRPWKRLSL